MRFQIPRLYAIIDAARLKTISPVDMAEILVGAGVKLIQYRDKKGSSGRMLDVSSQIANCVRGAGVTFIVNDRADVAFMARADGVHVGQDDLPVESARRVLETGSQPGLSRPRIIGCSTHNLWQVTEADGTSADYVAFGPVFATNSKERPDPVVGLAGVKTARGATRKPLVAIGGITLDGAAAVIQAGADSVAIIGDLLTDTENRAREFLRVLERAGERSRSSRDPS
jgi:thiamine-phosphate pyrophosphorylase